MDEINGIYAVRERWWWWAIIVLVLFGYNITVLCLGFRSLFCFNSAMQIAGILLCSFIGALAFEEWRERRIRRAIIQKLTSRFHATPDAHRFGGNAADPRYDSKLWSRKSRQWLFLGLFGVVYVSFFLRYNTIEEIRESEGPNLAIAVIVVFWCAYCFANLIACRKIAKNLQGGGFATFIAELLIQAGCPFAVYLRNFENERNIADALPPSFFQPPPSRVPASERAVLSKFADAVPIFCLTNDRDFSILPTAIRLRYARDDWEDVFNYYASNAALLVLKIDKISTGIQYEFEWIQAHQQVAKRTVLVGNKRVIEDLKASADGILSSVGWVIPTETDSVVLPESLNRCLNELAKEQMESTVIHG